MKFYFLSILFTIITEVFCIGQNQRIDNLKLQLANVQQDTTKIIIMAELCDNYRLSKPDSALNYGEQALILAQKIKFLKGESIALCNLSRTIRELGNLPKALQLGLKALRIAEENHYLKEKMECFTAISAIYFDLYDYPKYINYNQKVKDIAQKLNNKSRFIGAELNIAIGYLKNNQLDSSLYYKEKIQSYFNGTNPTYYRYLAWLNSKLGNSRTAINFLKKGIQVALKNNDLRNVSFNCNELASLYLKMNYPDSCILFAKQGFIEAKKGPFNIRILESSGLLAKAYKINTDYKQAYEYQELMVKTKESLYGAGNIQALQNMIADEETRQKELETERIANQNKLKQYGLLTGLSILILIGFILYRNNRQKHKANLLLSEQKEKVEQTLKTLQSTQAQLIQKEKLASLGELTAGIAHEIQNPLNFVNNFSEVSEELVEELEEEQQKPKRDPELEAELLGDLKQNLHKINHHGKRASAIVKGMLEHSRTGTGERQLTDINQLANEYLRLSYHGLRAKNTEFNSDYELSTDENLPNIEVVPQEIGRVLLNLINNAFYAVNERAKQGETDYQPKVTILTKTNDNQIEIRVQDNGNGIPDSIKSKIFQPFFTTKPTGEGTGLGLSLAYDIVTKGHGGTLEIETKEGVGTTFIVKLPMQIN
jgi:two-component system NtrC family sensor kinase